MTVSSFYGIRQRLPDGEEMFPVYMVGSRRALSIFDIWRETRWVLFGDVARTLDVGQSTLGSWGRIHNLIHMEKRPFRCGVCIPYEDVLAMEVRLRVKALVGRGKVTPWAEIDAWIAMGPEAIAAEAARQGIDELGEVGFDEFA